MIDTIVRSFLGKWGSAALDFYIANSLWINLVLVSYVILLIWSQRTYKLILTQILNDLAKEYGTQLAEKKPDSIVKILKKREVQWESLNQLSKFPLISAPRSYWFQVKNEDSLRNMFSPERLAKILASKAESSLIR